jgi:hypothetical protein
MQSGTNNNKTAKQMVKQRLIATADHLFDGEGNKINLNVGHSYQIELSDKKHTFVRISDDLVLGINNENINEYFELSRWKAQPAWGVFRIPGDPAASLEDAHCMHRAATEAAGLDWITNKANVSQYDIENYKYMILPIIKLI